MTTCYLLETTAATTVVPVMSLTTSSSALQRCGLTQGQLAALSNAGAGPPGQVHLVVLNGAATILEVDREVARYLALARSEFSQSG